MGNLCDIPGRLRGSGKNSSPLQERPIVRKMTCVKRVPTVLCDRPSPFPERRKARNPGISFSVLPPAARSFCFAGLLPPISCCRADCFLPQEADMPGTGSRADVAERALRGRAVGFVSPVLYAGQCGSVRLATGRSSSPSVRVSVRTVRAQEPLSVFRRLDAVRRPGFPARAAVRIFGACATDTSESASRLRSRPARGVRLQRVRPPGDGRPAAPLPNMTGSRRSARSAPTVRYVSREAGPC